MHLPDVTETLSRMSIGARPYPPEATAASKQGSARAPQLEVCRLAHDREVVRSADAYGLSVADVAWGDSPKAFDTSSAAHGVHVTLRVSGQSDRCSIIRNPAAQARSHGYQIGHFHIKTGNERGERLVTQPLREYLNGLLMPSDHGEEAVPAEREVIVEPQTCVLPLQHDTCTFDVEMFHDPTNELFPAILAVVCTDEGTSAQVVTKPGPASLWFNRNGQSCHFSAELRRPEWLRDGCGQRAAVKAQDAARDMLLIFQMPVRISPESQALFPNLYTEDGDKGGTSTSSSGLDASVLKPALGTSAHPYARGTRRASHARLGTTAVHGTFSALPSNIELDPAAAIRCTMQHYFMTDTNTLSSENVGDMRKRMGSTLNRFTASGARNVGFSAGARSTGPKYF